MKSKLILTKWQNELLSVLYHELPSGKDLPIEIELYGQDTILNRIYVGRVSQVVGYLNAAFVEYESGKNAYYPLNDRSIPVFTKKQGPTRQQSAADASPVKLSSSRIVQGDELLIQISREPLKTKDPVATSNLTFPGRYVILTVGNTRLGISSKIDDEQWREEVKNRLTSYCTEEYGWILRTNSYQEPLDVLEEEMKSLRSQWLKLKEKAVTRTCYTVMYRPPSSYLSRINGLYRDSSYELITDQPEIYQELCTYVQQELTDLEVSVRLYQDPMISLWNCYSMEKLLSGITEKKVWLKSGGYLIIEPTEALTVIDVNTGKLSTRKKNQEAVYQLNLEAAHEIFHTLRLRNISGIIVVDFINMQENTSQQQLLDEMRELARKDPVKTTVVDLTPLGLVELTRKKIRRPVGEQLKNCF